MKGSAKYANRALGAALMLVVCLPVLCNSEPEQVIAQQVVEGASHRWQWARVWTGAMPAPGYRAGERVRVEVAQSDQRVLLCLPALALCEIHSYGFDGLYFRTAWHGRTPPAALDKIDQNLLDALTGNIPPSLPEIRTFGASGLGSQPPLVYKTDVRLPEISDAEYTASRDAGIGSLAVFEADTLKEVASYRSEGCGPGYIDHARLPAADKRAYLHVNLGGTCGEGILIMEKNPTARWTQSVFSLNPEDTKVFRRLIESHKPARLALEASRPAAPK